MTPSEQHILLLSTLLQLEKRTRHAESVPELSFIMVNETLRLTKYRQALLWTSGPGGKITVDSVSGVDMPDANAPFIMYMRGLLKHLLRRTDNGDVHLLQEKDLDEKYRSGWQEWDMGTALWCPLVFPRGKLPGGLLFSRQKEWDNGEIALLQGLTDAYAHAWYALKGNRFFPKNPAMLIYEGWRKRGAIAGPYSHCLIDGIAGETFGTGPCRGCAFGVLNCQCADGWRDSAFLCGTRAGDKNRAAALSS